MKCFTKKIALWTFACLLATSTGCGTLGSIGNTLTFWSDDRPSPTAKDANPDQIAAALDATRAKMHFAPKEPYWAYRMGELYVMADSTAQAVTHLQTALAIDPSYAPAAALLSKVYYEAAQYDPAVGLLEGFLSRNANAPDALRAALALHLEALGDLDGAQAVLADCSDSSKEARAARTFVTLRDDNLQAALDSATEALDDNSRSAVNQNNYGIALLWAGRPAEAREAFLKALEFDDTLPGAFYNMAIVEAFYFFNEDAGREWFARYQQFANDDPDDLASLLGTDVTQRSNNGETED